MIVNDERYLQHYGVLGMHWGVRKDESSNNKSGEKKPIFTKERLEKAASIAAAGLVIGGAVAAAIAQRNENVKMRDVRKSLSEYHASKRLFDQRRHIKLTQINKAVNAGNVSREHGFALWRLLDRSHVNLLGRIAQREGLNPEHLGFHAVRTIRTARSGPQTIFRVGEQFRS